MTQGQSILRNLFHFSGVVIPLTYALVNRRAALWLTVTLLCILLLVEFLRITGRINLRTARGYLKEKERTKPTGSLFYAVASLLTIILFQKETAVSSLLVLTVSDPLSSFVGLRLGRHPIFGKSVEGTLAFFGSSLIILLLFSVGFFTALAVAGIAALTELFTPSFLDDNLTIPIITGLALTLFSAF